MAPIARRVCSKACHIFIVALALCIPLAALTLCGTNLMETVTRSAQEELRQIDGTSTQTPANGPEARRLPRDHNRR